MSYNKLSNVFSAFTSSLTSIKFPKNVQEALVVPGWRGAVMEEMKALKK